VDEDEIRAVKAGMQVWGQYLERFHPYLAEPPTDPKTLDKIFRDNSKSMDAMVKSARLVNRGVLDSLDEKIVLLKSLGEQIKLFTWWALGIAATIGLIIPLLIYKSITNDLVSIRTGIRHIAQGDFSYRIPLYSKDELGMLAESFNIMSLRLKELDNMKSEFISIVSHELRTPLTSMKEAANLLKEGLTGELNERQKRLITIMQQGMDRLLQMISELLEISKLESGMVELQIAPYSINDVVSGFLSEIQPYAGKKGIELKVSYMPESVHVPLDRNKILRVLTNLTQNAIKYSGEGSKVELRLGRQDDDVLIEVEDHGLGIPVEDIPLIFEKFYQSKATRGHSGIGLGLAISRSIVDAHGGKIYAKSTIGKGSVFTFTLPVHPHVPAVGVRGNIARPQAQPG
jgi:two-component system, NtrC family, sensor histidine kinase GlrK